MTRPALMICLQCGSEQHNRHGCYVGMPDAVKLHKDVSDIMKSKYPQAYEQLDIMFVRCLRNCTTPVAWGLRADDKYNYAFAPALDAETVAKTAAQWMLETPDGNLPRSKVMDPSLRKTMRARIPPAIPEVLTDEDPPYPT